MKKVIALMFSLFLINILWVSNLQANNSNVTVKYFYSSTCGTCQKLTGYLDGLKDKYANMILEKYNIADMKNKSLFNRYSSAYKVSEDDDGIVPVVFIKNTYLTGERLIKQNLETLIIKNDGLETQEIKDTSENFDPDIKQFMNFKTLSVFFAGIINGINPCSMSMLLFFISLIMVRKVNIMNIGVAFCVGKFTAYLFLGTIFFSLLSNLNISWFHTVLKFIMLVAVIILIFLNIQDFFAAKNEKYNKIKVQLPISFRKFNHRIIKKVSNVADLKLILLISFALGMLISLGEFLCTGQIYLTTIVTILHTSTTLNLQAFIYLIIYDLAFIVPLLILTFVIYKGKEVFEVSETIREKLHLIKIINVGIFLIFGIIVLFFF
jgi:cytochrome c biogenesis protein CcdA